LQLLAKAQAQIVSDTLTHPFGQPGAAYIAALDVAAMTTVEIPAAVAICALLPVVDRIALIQANL